MKRPRIAIMIAAIVTVGLIYYFKFYLPGLSDSEIKASGHIEVTEVDMSFRIPGHVAKIFVDEGMKPRKGEVMAELEQEVIKARRDQVEAQVRELEAREASLALTIKIKEEVLDAMAKFNVSTTCLNLAIKCCGTGSPRGNCIFSGFTNLPFSFIL